MARLQSITINGWQGLDARGQFSVSSERYGLDVPKVLRNVHLDERGRLYYPAARAELAHTFADDIFVLRYIERPRGILVQLHNGQVWFVKGLSGRDFDDTAGVELLTTLSQTQWPIWSLSSSDVSYFGWGARGGSTGSQTFRVSGTTASPVLTNISGASPDTSYSEFFKGRRFTVYQDNEVRFSNLNDYEAFEENNFFTIAGDDGGTSWDTYKGFVQGMVAWEDVLLIFLTGSVWLLTGAGPDTWNLRQAMTTVGNSAAFALTRTERGAMSYGGENAGDPGVFLFTGQSARKVSEMIDPLIPIDSGLDFYATKQYDTYLLCKPTDELGVAQVFVYDMTRDTWTTFSGWLNAAVAPSPAGLFLTSNDQLWFHDREQRYFPRHPSLGGRVKVGFYDEGAMHDLYRFVALKVTAKRLGTIASTMNVTCRIPNAEGSDPGRVVESAIEVSTDDYVTYTVPLNIRGPALEIEFFFASTANAGLLVESMQLIYSKKGGKLARATDPGQAS